MVPSPSCHSFTSAKFLLNMTFTFFTIQNKVSYKIFLLNSTSSFSYYHTAKCRCSYYFITMNYLKMHIFYRCLITSKGHAVTLTSKAMWLLCQCYSWLELPDFMKISHLVEKLSVEICATTYILEDYT